MIAEDAARERHRLQSIGVGFHRQIHPAALAPLRIFSGVDAGLMNGVGHGGAITHQADCRRVLAS